MEKVEFFNELEQQIIVLEDNKLSIEKLLKSIGEIKKYSAISGDLMSWHNMNALNDIASEIYAKLVSNINSLKDKEEEIASQIYIEDDATQKHAMNTCSK